VWYVTNMLISLVESVFCYCIIKRAESKFQKTYTAPIFNDRYLVEATSPVSFTNRFAFIIVELLNLSMGLWCMSIYFYFFLQVSSRDSSNHFIVTYVCPILAGLQCLLIFRLAVFFTFFIIVPAKVEKRQRIRF